MMPTIRCSALAGTDGTEVVKPPLHQVRRMHSLTPLPLDCALRCEHFVLDSQRVVE